MPGKEIDSKGMKGREPKESGTKSDVNDGRHEHMRYSHHEMGTWKEGEHHHDHHRGKKD